MWYRQFFLISYLTISACAADADAVQVHFTDTKNEVIGQTIEARFLPPEPYVRPQYDTLSFANYLRTLPLKSPEAPVKLYNGKTKAEPVHAAVVDMKIGQKNLHQCADAIMRLRAEYLWTEEAYEKIHFNFTSGDRIDYVKWMQGSRVVVAGNDVKWKSRSGPSNTYDDFWSYMETIFMYAGTASFAKELEHVDLADAQVGDVLIQGGFPGHAVLILDMVVHKKTGKKLHMLGQSYMPAQDFHVLKNMRNKTKSPWYDLNRSSNIVTPEWTFARTDLKRFRD